MRTWRMSLAGTVILALLGGMGGLTLAQSEGEGSGRVTMEVVEWLGGEAARVEASDPRLSGIGTENWNCRASADFEVCVGTWRVENEGGTWLGRMEGFNHASGMYDWTVLEGQGGYEGLTALRVIAETMGSEGIHEMVILDFEMPEQPEPILPSAE